MKRSILLSIAIIVAFCHPVLSTDESSQSEITMKTEVISENPRVQVEKLYRGDQEIARQKFRLDAEDWILLESEGQIPDGVVKENYPNGKLHFERSFNGGKRAGNIQEFYEHGTLKSETPYADGIVQGASKEYYPIGKVHYERTFKNGKRDGAFKEFYENGILKVGRVYIDGKEDGIRKEYYPTGVLMSSWMMKDGYVQGMVTKYNENGTFDHESLWENGLPTSSMVKHHQYYSTGEIKYIYFYNYTGGTVEPESPLGFSKDYYKNGQLWREFKIKSNNGARISDFKEYDQDGKVISGQEGWFNGTLKDFYENGNLKSERNFVDGIGTQLTCYDEKGIQKPIQKIGAMTNCESLGEVLNKEDSK